LKKLLIQSAKILDPQSAFNGKIADVLVSDGKITEIGEKISASDKDTIFVSAKGQVLSPGFFDLNVNFGEPGLETKEDMGTGCMTAAAGGFTGLALMPNTQPPIHSKAEVSYLISKSKNNLVQSTKALFLLIVLSEEKLVSLYLYYFSSFYLFNIYIFK
jgi:dihydroorotase